MLNTVQESLFLQLLLFLPYMLPLRPTDKNSMLCLLERCCLGRWIWVAIL